MKVTNSDHTAIWLSHEIPYEPKKSLGSMYQGFWGILLMLIYDVWFLKSKILFLVYDLKNYTDDKSCYTKAC